MTERLLPGAQGRVTELGQVFGSDLIAAIERLVDERVTEALARQRPVPKRWLSVAEAGDYLGCSSKAVYARIKRGRIPEAAVRRTGRTVIIDRLALDRTLDL